MNGPPQLGHRPPGPVVLPLRQWWRSNRIQLMLAPALFVVWVGLLVLTSWLREVFTPVFIAILLAFIFNPAVSRMERLGVHRVMSITALYLLLLVPLAMLIYFAGPGLLNELVTESNGLAASVEQFKGVLRNLLSNYPDLRRMLEAPEAGRELGSELPPMPGLDDGDAPGEGLVPRWSTLLQTVLGFLLNRGWLGVLAGGLLLVGFYLFFLLKHWNDLIGAVDRHLPRQYRGPFLRTARRVDRMMAGFFRGRLPIMIAVGLLTAGGLRACQVPYSVLIGVATGIATLIPVLPLVVGFVPTCISAYVSHEGSWPWVATAAGVFLGIQFLEAFVLSPLVQGRRNGLHPVTIVLSLLLGAHVAGTFGVLVALPTAAFIKVIGTEFVLPPLRKLADPEGNARMYDER